MCRNDAATVVENLDLDGLGCVARTPDLGSD